jgi:hypothetical protein
MPIDPRAPDPIDPRAVQVDKLVELERRLAALERGGQARPTVLREAATLDHVLDTSLYTVDGVDVIIPANGSYLLLATLDLEITVAMGVGQVAYGLIRAAGVDLSSVAVKGPAADRATGAIVERADLEAGDHVVLRVAKTNATGTASQRGAHTALTVLGPF